jgi:hypothetical protein
LADTRPCPPVFNCMLLCGDDQGCAAACGPTTPEVGAEVETLLHCAEANDCNLDIGCIVLSCTDEYLACEQGDMTCSEVWACMLPCDFGGLCAYNCITEAASETVGPYNALQDCVQAHDCEDQACIDMHCSAEAMACGI